MSILIKSLFHYFKTLELVFLDSRGFERFLYRSTAMFKAFFFEEQFEFFLPSVRYRGRNFGCL